MEHFGKAPINTQYTVFTSVHLFMVMFAWCKINNITKFLIRLKLLGTRGAKLGKIQGGGCWRGNPRFGSIFRRVHFLAFLRKAIKKSLYLR